MGTNASIAYRKQLAKQGIWTALLLVAFPALSGPLDNAWLKGSTDKNPVAYKPGEEMVFTIEPQEIEGEVPDGIYLLWWRRSDDYGATEEGVVPFTTRSFVYKTSLAHPGFVRLEAYVLNKDGSRFVKKFTGDAVTPEGRKAMNKFERSKKNVFFDGGAGVDIDKLALAPEAEPADFDAFWARQFARLDKVGLTDERIEIASANPEVRVYAVRVDCAGLRPVTGYLSIPKTVDGGATFPCRLVTDGYSGDSCTQERPGWCNPKEITLRINAHGLKLPEFGATDADTKALRCEVRSNGWTYAFDPEQNNDPETAYFNGMVLRVKRALHYLKTVKGWNGRDLFASGGSQGGLQTIWAAACGEGVTQANSDITWCCDLAMNNRRLEEKAAGDGWYIRWVPGVAYYDAVVWAKRIPPSCRVNISRAGLGDYCCPPMGLAKLWNSIPGNKSIKWVQGSEHGYVPPDYEGRDWSFDTTVGTDSSGTGMARDTP
jgi:cephalosporin-C deacetylase-like acetyl esterase